MNIEKEILENRQVKVVATIEDERLAKEMRNAARRIGKNARIPGFRKGKVPYNVLLNMLGEEALIEEALEPLAQEVYQEMFDEVFDLRTEEELEEGEELGGEEKIVPYAPGTLVDFAKEPAALTFMIPLIPTIELGDYRDFRLEFIEVSVDDEEVDNVINQKRMAQATMNPVERKLAMGDFAMMDVTGIWLKDEEPETEEDEEKNNTWLARKDVQITISEDATYPAPGFSAMVVGMEMKDNKEFEMSFAEDDEDVAEALRGKTLQFTVQLNEVLEQELPELDDEFVQGISDFDTLDEFLADLKESLLKEAQVKTDREYFDGIVEGLLGDDVKLAYPPMMIDEQLDRTIQNFAMTLQRVGFNIDEYMKMQNLTEEKLREDFREDAIKELERGLLVSEIAATEKIHVAATEIDEELDKFFTEQTMEDDVKEQWRKDPQMRESIATQIFSERTVARIVAIAKGENPEIVEFTEEEEETEPEEVAADTSDTPHADEVDEIEAVAEVEETVVEESEPEVEGDLEE